VLALRVRWLGGQVVTLHNFGAEPVDAQVSIRDETDGGEVREVLADAAYPEPDEPGKPIPVNRYGYRWLRLVHQAETAPW
jgi:hypothetical protein